MERTVLLSRREKIPDRSRQDRDIIMDLQDTTPDSMIRRTPYTVIRIPRLHRTILVDDLIGEATLVLM